MTHLNIEFPRNVAQGCQRSLERRDEVVTLASGHEEVNQRWQHSRRSWNAGLAVRSAEDLAHVVAIFEEARGRKHSFAFRDWQDWQSFTRPAGLTPLDQPLGALLPNSSDYGVAVGDGETRVFQVCKRYGSLNPYLRPICLPHHAGFRVAVNGGELVSGWALSAIGGQLEFDTPPPDSATLTAGFTFDVPVRFQEAQIVTDWVYFTEQRGLGAVPNVGLVEKRID
ncbi:DUF2460 domain-containing protein [Tropicibacter sp. R15_0]|uniref:DUF2460 domain-containing protein n=1 Tax=Tropicibacter sp. R15_0 TaxID=2821101 RepID=UPI001ADABEB4|nr:DUF2460 domain-containing protein [Tropicibacter sp. R15_0]MBO9467064.1 DUF2460 domain-containing protein [Tropicibacter sp. R15_0]